MLQDHPPNSEWCEMLSPSKTNRFWLFRSTKRKEDQGVVDGIVQVRYGLHIKDAEPVKEHTGLG